MINSIAKSLPKERRKNRVAKHSLHLLFQMIIINTFVTFIDDYSKYTWVYFLHARFDVFSAFQKYLALVETQFSKNIKIFCSNSGEYVSKSIPRLLQAKGFRSQRA
eukprot:TRINITY_DN60825_c0_g1_i1.p1 TRINITY_DN60825_c0_g1~~TRINITY_DN60825_c0_g1_i1.p1  ORF type:complete len:106 (+),score=3.44 TRINITY_DN60825_c0_g1_i1:793-1110(+)